MKTSFNPQRQNISFGFNTNIVIAEEKPGIRIILDKLTQKAVSALKKAPEDTFETTLTGTVAEAKDAINNYKPGIFIAAENIDKLDIKKPDGIELANFAKKEGVKSIGIVADDANTVSKAIENGYEALSKKDMLDPLKFRMFFGKLMDKLKY